MIGDPQSIRAFKTSITPENVKFFEDSDSDRIWNINFVSVHQNQTHHILDQLKASQSMLSTEVGEEWVLQDPANGWSRNAQSDHPVSFHFQSNQTFCASFFLSVFMQLLTREHLRKSLLKTLQLMGWHVSATRHLFITIWADLLPCLNLLMSPLVTAKVALREGFLVPAIGPWRGLQPRLCDRAICAEEGSELDDVANEVFDVDDITYEGAVVI